jgi:hypothetical protein
MLLRDWDFTKFFQDLNGRLESSPKQQNSDNEAIEAPARHRRADSDVAGKFRREHSDLFPRRSSLLFGARNNQPTGEPVLTDFKPQASGPEWLRRREKTDVELRRRQDDTSKVVAPVAGQARRRNSSHLAPGEQVSPRKHVHKKTRELCMRHIPILCGFKWQLYTSP